MTTGEKPLMISVHIPKTGGTTFATRILRPAFGDRILTDYNDRPMAHSDAKRNDHALHFTPGNDILTNYDCIHGHFLPMKYANVTRRCEFVCWLRDPVQRVMSRFYHSRRAGRRAAAGDDPVTFMSFTEFCRWDHFHNLYAKYLWSFDINRFDFIGITEDYDRSINVFRRRFRIDIWDGRVENVNPDKDVHKAYVISSKDREYIERANAEDMEIYERGKRHLDNLERSTICF